MKKLNIYYCTLINVFRCNKIQIKVMLENVTYPSTEQMYPAMRPAERDSWLFFVTWLQQILCRPWQNLNFYCWSMRWRALLCHAYAYINGPQGGRGPNYAYLGCWLYVYPPSLPSPYPYPTYPVAAINSVNGSVCKCANAFAHSSRLQLRVPPHAPFPCLARFARLADIDPSVLLSRFYYANIF